MHPKTGSLRAFLDEELDPISRKELQTHLEKCQDCQTRFEILKSRSMQVDSVIASLNSETSQKPSTKDSVRSRLVKLTTDDPYMGHNFTKREPAFLPRSAWLTLVVLSMMFVSLFFSPVRAIANNFLSLFRVEQVRVLEFNPDQIPEDLEASAQFEYMLSNNINVQERGEIQELVSVEQAEALAGFRVRLPQLKEGEETLKFQPGGSAEINIDIEQIRTVLGDIGRSDIILPDNLNGAIVSIEIPGGIIAQYGDCESEVLSQPSDINDMEELENITLPQCTTLIQMPSPVISAPPNLDVVQIGEAFLQIIGMSREEATTFARNVDWTTTLIIPVPSYATDHEEVLVDGVTGAFIQQYRFEGPDEYMMIWIKDGVVFALSGPGDKETALEIAGSIK